MISECRDIDRALVFAADSDSALIMSLLMMLMIFKEKNADEFKDQLRIENCVRQ
jgi:hypothetical protein